jgi:hypothetical protein
VGAEGKGDLYDCEFLSQRMDRGNKFGDRKDWRRAIIWERIKSSFLFISDQEFI